MYGSYGTKHEWETWQVEDKTEKKLTNNIVSKYFDGMIITFTFTITCMATIQKNVMFVLNTTHLLPHAVLIGSRNVI